MLYKFYWESPDDEGHVYDEKYIIAVVEDEVDSITYLSWFLVSLILL